MVNQPSYNPNDRDQLKPELYRNRAATDIFEPGSSVKPFIMVAALASGQYRPDSVIDTYPGFFKVGNTVEEDEHDFGVIDLATILAKSSNVGTAKVALSLKPEQIYHAFTGLGLGQVTGSNFPGESAGTLTNYAHWRPIGIATCRTATASRSRRCSWRTPTPPSAPAEIRRPITFETVSGPVPGERVIDAKVARELIGLMEQVVQKGGTATRPHSLATGFRARRAPPSNRGGGLFHRQVHGGFCRFGARIASQVCHRCGDR